VKFPTAKEESVIAVRSPRRITVNRPMSGRKQICVFIDNVFDSVDPLSIVKRKGYIRHTSIVSRDLKEPRDEERLGILLKLIKPPGKRGGSRPRSAVGPRCKVCRDPRLHAISADLAAGMSQNAIARKYGFTQPVVWKHVHQHQGAALIEHNLSQPVLDQIRKLNQRTLRILDEAERGKGKDPNLALAAIREARHNLELIARLTGEDKSSARSEAVKIEVVYVDRQLVIQQPLSTPAQIEEG
jgi:hypothetical protein